MRCCGRVGNFSSARSSVLRVTRIAAPWSGRRRGCRLGRFAALARQKGLGLVSEVLSDLALQGSAAIAHNRYSTAGEKNVRNVQPFRAHFRDGPVAIAHNGNLTNAPELRKELELRGSIFATSSDTEVILHLMATSVVATSGLARKAADALGRVQGAYSLLLLTPESIIAVRDPYGFRPLVLGEINLTPDGLPAPLKHDAHGSAHLAAAHADALPPALVFASETCALDIVNARYVREVEPGELVEVRRDGSVSSHFPFAPTRRRACVFEHVYFSRPSSVVFSRSVYLSRFRFGELLAQRSPVPNADAIVAVPESGVPAALGFAFAAGVPYQQAIMRSHYVGRTFIEPTQVARDLGVRLKLSPVEALIRGKSLVVVDDSIVRGTTSLKIVRMLREAGAREVHMRIACPPITRILLLRCRLLPDRDKLYLVSHGQRVRSRLYRCRLARIP
eukprot:IDg8074t1